MKVVTNQGSNHIQWLIVSNRDYIRFEKLRSMVIRNQKNKATSRVVQNRTIPIENCKSNKSKPKRIWFGCIHINFLINRMVWFGFGFDFTNRTKPNQTTI